MGWIQAEEKVGFRPIPRGISAGEGSMTERRKEKENIWNVPNVLTMIRMGLIPVYWILMLNDHFYVAFAVFAAASLTDIADGFIARKYQLITNFGKLMDPLADKLMSISVMLSMAIKGIAPWAVLIILLCKEAVMVMGGVVLYRNDVVVYSIWIGKLAQTFDIEGREALTIEAEKILLADSSKLGKIGFGKICNLSDIDILITDSGLSPASRGRIEMSGVKVLIA